MLSNYVKILGNNFSDFCFNYLIIILLRCDDKISINLSRIMPNGKHMLISECLYHLILIQKLFKFFSLHNMLN